MRRTLNRYFLKEIYPTFFVSLFVTVFIIMATKMLSIMELIITRGVNFRQVIWMVIFLLPDIIAFALPAASLMAVVVAFLRLSADSEIIAMKSSGISLYQMLPPVILFAFFGFIIAGAIGSLAMPWGNRSFKDVVFKIAESKADLGIKERIFSEPFDNVFFYVNSYSARQSMMKDVFVVDRRDPEMNNTIISKSAVVFKHPREKTITIQFFEGTIFMLTKAMDTGRTILFKTYALNIGIKDVMANLASRERAPKEMSINELLSRLHTAVEKDVKYNEMQIALYEKISFPLAVFLMAIIGVPLGAQIKGRGRTAGISVSLVVFLLFYMGLAGARSICETGIITPSIGVWFPVLFLVSVCIYLIWCVANERPINIFRYVGIRSKSG